MTGVAAGACCSTTTGLVGPGAAAEFLTWRANADLPNPDEVTADPSTVPWADLDPSRAILAAVIAPRHRPGTQDAWRAAWAHLAAATDHGLGDVTAAQARPLLTTAGLLN